MAEVWSSSSVTGLFFCLGEEAREKSVRDVTGVCVRIASGTKHTQHLYHGLRRGAARYRKLNMGMLLL